MAYFVDRVLNVSEPRSQNKPLLYTNSPPPGRRKSPARSPVVPSSAPKFWSEEFEGPRGGTCEPGRTRVYL